MSKETAFYPRLEALTDQWMDLFGYWAPLVLTDTEAEYRAVRESASLMDFTMLRKVDIEGPGALLPELVRRGPGAFRRRTGAFGRDFILPPKMGELSLKILPSPSSRGRKRSVSALWRGTSWRTGPAGAAGSRRGLPPLRVP